MAHRLPAPFHYATATTITTEADGTVAVRYHRTDVATLHPDGTVTLRTGGWRTVTTKRRINQALRYFGVPTVVYQHRFNWYLAPRDQGDRIEFTDGMRIRANGHGIEVAA